MRFDNYIKEEQEWLNDAVDKIQKDCGPWLKQSKLLPGYRASRNNMPNYISKVSVRSDRRPLTTPHDIHKIVDDIFNKQYGWRARSNVVCMQGNNSVHMFYGRHVYAVYPIGKFKYLWSTKIQDLTPELDELMNQLDADGVDQTHSDFYTILKNDIENIIVLDGKYKSTDLHGALVHYPTHEIMVNCKEYYMVPHAEDIFVGKELYARFH